MGKDETTSPANNNGNEKRTLGSLFTGAAQKLLEAAAPHPPTPKEEEVPVNSLLLKKSAFFPKYLPIPTLEAVKALSPVKVKLLSNSSGEIIISSELNCFKAPIHLRNLILL